MLITDQFLTTEDKLNLHNIHHENVRFSTWKLER